MSKKYVRPWPGPSWFTRRPGYVKFMVRELTSVFLAIYLVMLLVFIARLGKGAESFVALLNDLTSPGWMVLHALTLVGVVWHAITFFAATPQAMPMFIGEKKVPGPALIFATGYGPWIVVSAIIFWFLCPGH